jgi:hypothetical protein
MRVRTDNRWSSRTPAAAVAVAMPYSAALEFAPLREKVAIVRDTLIVLGVQIAFRVSILLRHLNY